MRKISVTGNGRKQINDTWNYRKTKRKGMKVSVSIPLFHLTCLAAAAGGGGGGGSEVYLFVCVVLYLQLWQS